MQEHLLNGFLRSEKGSANVRRLRAQGFIPAVIYGKDIEPLPVKINYKDLQKMGKLSKSVIINLSIENNNSYPVILKEVQRDILTNKFSTLDFLKVSLTEKMTAKVSVHFIGDSKGVKEGGILEPLIRELKIQCLPADLPEFIEVDVANLEIGDTLHISDLKLKEGITILDEAEEGLVTVLAPTVEEEKKPVEAEAATAEGETKAATAETTTTEAKDSKGKTKGEG